MNSVKLNSIISRACEQLLHASVQNEPTWNALLPKLKRAGLCETVSFEQWAKFQWRRHPVNLNREELVADADSLSTAVNVIAENLHRLLARELSSSSLLVLAKLDARLLDIALTQLWLNQLTGDQVARLILHDGIQLELDSALRDALAI